MPQSIRVFLRKYGYWLSLLAALAGAVYFAWQTWELRAYAGFRRAG